jgi:hypothetical protein
MMKAHRNQAGTRLGSVPSWRRYGRKQRTAAETSLSVVIALAVLVSGAVHLDLWLEGYRFIPLIGPLFLLNAAAALFIATALLWPGGMLVILLAAGFGASTLAAFLLSATVGFLGFTEALTGQFQYIAGGAEVAIVVLAGYLAVVARP